ncbi:hypothetical protein JW911_04225 [Candidatus Peregrinibacteria bacterium]|nr:hypothetical protein [Candidatus Peregrinibacteria bacterium]
MPITKNNLKRYADEQQLDPKKTGEVVLAAAESSSEIGVDPKGLKALGILPSDTKQEVIQKLREAFESKEAVDKFFGKKMSDVPQYVGMFHITIMHVLNWLGEKP